MALAQAVLSAQLEELRKTKRMAERAFAQLRDEDFFFRLNDQQNSIFVYVKHLTGNMRSRFTDFLTSDGEKPDRNREGEFVDEPVGREQMMAMWEAGWRCVFSAIESLSPADLERTVLIRKEPHSVVLAITRQVAHYSYHVGQIVLLAKHIKTGRGEAWDYLTVPPGGSQEFNRSKGLTA